MKAGLPHPHDTLVEKEQAFPLVWTQVNVQVRVHNHIHHRKPTLIVRPLVCRRGAGHHQRT